MHNSESIARKKEELKRAALNARSHKLLHIKFKFFYGCNLKEGNEAGRSWDCSYD